MPFDLVRSLFFFFISISVFPLSLCWQMGNSNGLDTWNIHSFDSFSNQFFLLLWFLSFIPMHKVYQACRNVSGDRWMLSLEISIFFYSSLLNIFTGSIHLPSSPFRNVFEINDSLHSLCKYVAFCTNIHTIEERENNGRNKDQMNKSEKIQNESRGNDISISFNIFAPLYLNVQCAMCSFLSFVAFLSVRFPELFR